MRGENKRPMYSAATVVDHQGATKYYILPGKLAVLAVSSMIILVIIAILLGFMIVKNKYEIDSLKQQVQVNAEDGTRK